MLELITSIGGLLVSEGIIHPVASDEALTWFIRYICYRNLKFLNNIINKAKVLLPQASVPLAALPPLPFFFWLFCLGPLVFCFQRY